MFTESYVRLLSWLFFAALSVRLLFRSALRLQIDYVGKPDTFAAEVLLQLNSFLVTVLGVIWLYRHIVGSK